jgi:hypothetical protein
MVEYTRELLNSNCHIGWVRTVVKRATALIETRVWEVVGNVNVGKRGVDKRTKIIYDLTADRDMSSTIYAHKFNDKYDVELSWKVAMDMIVIELKKVFIDSNIHYNNKEIFDIYDIITMHRLITVDWGGEEIYQMDEKNG